MGETSIVVSAVSSVTDVFTSLWTLITSNPAALFYLGCGFVGGGFGVFKRMKRSVR